MPPKGKKKKKFPHSINCSKGRITVSKSPQSTVMWTKALIAWADRQLCSMQSLKDFSACTIFVPSSHGGHLLHLLNQSWLIDVVIFHMCHIYGHICCIYTYIYVVIFHIDVGFPGGSDSKESSRNARDLGSIPGSGRTPGEGNDYFLPGESHGQRTLVGYSP